MKTTAATIAFVASAVSSVYAQSQLVIQSPASLVQCQPALVSFSGGSAPYFISVIPGGQAGAAALSQFPVQSGTSYTWTVDQPAGSSITLQIRDSTGQVNYSSQVDVQSSSDSTCLGGNTSVAGSAAAGGSGSSSSARSSSGSSSSAAASASRTPLTTSSSSSTARSSTGTTTAPASSTTAGAGANANATSAPASTSATGAASSKYLANMAGVAGIAALVAFIL